ncbi:MAG: dihydrodipicolinate synthase family protein, partial [Hungatella sp.]
KTVKEMKEGLKMDEKRTIVKEVIKMAAGRIPVFFSAAAFTTELSVEFAQYCEQQGADGVIFMIPPYVLVPQAAALIHLDTCMSAVSIPCGIYNNPSRLGVNVEPETIAKLLKAHPNFVVDKEAMPQVKQLVQVQRLCEGKIKIMCCDYPQYSIVIPTLAVGGTGTANIGGNIIPE